jgi:putative transposase
VDSDQKGGAGLGRLDESVEDQITTIIDEIYLEGKTVSETYKALTARLTDLELEVPHENTLRRRIRQRSEYEKIKRRIGPRTAAQKFDDKVGTMPNANTPLALIQIDHTELDIMLVDEEERKVLKKPWVTIVLDVCTRVVLGFHLSFDPPSAFSVGRAIAHAILRKEKFLKSIGLQDLSWPCWGKMTTIHCDNAKEFRGVMLKENCANYKITLKWRPPLKPEFGGHIERYMGTIAEELKNLVGNTKVSKEKRSKFNPEKTAAFTLSEFETWFTVWLIEDYHKRAHKGLNGSAPIDRWRDGIDGKNGHLGIGLPAVITDEGRLRLDLLPQMTRTVQRTGVELFNMFYFSGVLRPWINAVDQTAKGKEKPKRKFTFKYDPRDISSILFLNPLDNQYHEIQSNINIKPDKLSIWRYWQILAELKKNKTPIDERAILEAHRRLKAIEEEATRKTVDTRKRIEREKRMEKEEPLKVVKPEKKETVAPIFKISKNEITPYDELEYTKRRSFK